MSTRATYHFVDFPGIASEFHYHHYDGYLSGAAEHLMNAAKKTWVNPTGLLDGFKKAVSDEVIDCHERHGDTDYRYDIRWDAAAKNAQVTAWKRCWHQVDNSDFPDSTWELVFCDSLPEFFAAHYTDRRPDWTKPHE